MNKFDLAQKLKQLDETLLLELLDINAEELVDAFLVKIDERLDYLLKETENL
jgi:hypothetical protein